jgi:phospholipid transport system transporter-binding protein
VADTRSGRAGAEATPSVRLDGARLVFSGALDRPACARLWEQLRLLLGKASTLDLEAVSAVDSAGLALLAEVAARSPVEVSIVGAPAGFAELRAAYRLDESLGFAR